MKNFMSLIVLAVLAFGAGKWTSHYLLTSSVKKTMHTDSAKDEAPPFNDDGPGGNKN